MLFGLLLNLAVATTFVWTELVSPEVEAAMWMASAFLWFGSLAVAITQGERNRYARSGHGEDLFLAANGEYLKGRFAESAALLQQLIRRNRRDVEARLMLATIRRQENRWEEAKEHLRYLRRLDGAARWEWEIEREWAGVCRQEQEGEGRVAGVQPEPASPVPSN
jgi:hypothetical protein